MKGFGHAVTAIQVACILLTVGASALRHSPKDFCSLTPEVGPCDDDVPSFYYDARAGDCKPFSYGGCEGNRNRFNSIEECRSACGNIDAPLPELCPDDLLCCDANPPASCWDRCAMIRIDCSCSVERDCCSGFIRPGCEETCATAYCAPTCDVHDCCYGPATPGCESQCAFVDCPLPPTCAVADCCPGPTTPGCEQDCALVDCLPVCGAAECCSETPPPSYCTSQCYAFYCPAPPECIFSCCQENTPSQCYDYCAGEDCSLPCCPGAVPPFGTLPTPCRDCGYP